MSLDEAKKARAKPQQNSGEGTHLQIAEAAIEKMTEESGQPPVYALGRLWTFDFYSGLWTDRSIDSVAVSIGRDFPFHKSCRKASDYRAIAGLVLTLCEQSDYFENAPPWHRRWWLVLQSNQGRRDPARRIKAGAPTAYQCAE